MNTQSEIDHLASSVAIAKLSSMREELSALNSQIDHYKRDKESPERIAATDEERSVEDTRRQAQRQVQLRTRQIELSNNFLAKPIGATSVDEREATRLEILRALNEL